MQKQLDSNWIGGPSASLAQVDGQSIGILMNDVLYVPFTRDQSNLSCGEKSKSPDYIPSFCAPFEALTFDEEETTQKYTNATR